MPGGVDKNDGVLVGTISRGSSIVGRLTGDVSVTGGLTVETIKVPRYHGSYEVTPLPFADVIMETSGKLMEDDVTVVEIPYFETTNESGGYTVIIG